MKLSKFLLISTLIAFTLAIITLPVVAKPSIKSHFVHLQHTQPSQTAISLRSSLYDQFNNFNRIDNLSKTSSTFNRKVTSQFILNIKPIFQENDRITLNRSAYPYTFFETTMIFNDKLQQFLSLFNNKRDNGDQKQAKGCESKF
jgi:hypothetical protein